MANKTYLQLVNNVLLNLREAQVTDLSAVYSQLIGEFVNQAKEKTQAAWRWKALSTTLSFTTVLNQTQYILTAAATPAVSSSSGNYPGAGSEILTDQFTNPQVFDATTATSGGLIRLGCASREEEYALNIYLANQSPVQPNRYSYTYEGGQAVFSLVGAPQGGRTINLRMKVNQGAFTTTAGTEIIITPSRSVVSFATFLAMEERGEELSEKSSLYLDRHNQELEREIENDLSGEQAYMQLQDPTGGGGGSLYAGYNG